MNCPACGAKRPDDEIKNKSCANCVDLKTREELAKTADATKAAAEEQSAKESQMLKELPDLDKAGVYLYDNERGVWWLGINLKPKEANPVDCLFMMDQCKLSMIQAMANWKEKQRRRDSLIVRVGGQIKSGVDRVKELIPLVKS